MDAFLKCEVSCGQFSQEASVRFSDYTGEQLSLFVPKCEIRHEDDLSDDWSNGLLRVDVLDRKDGFSLIYLPGQTFKNGQAVTVEDNQLKFNLVSSELQAS